MQLLSLSAKSNIRLAVPDVVLRETARHWKIQADEAIEAARGRIDRVAKSKGRLASLGVDEAAIEVPKPLPEIEVDPRTFLIETLERIESLGGQILPVPSVSIEDVLERDLASRKPFSSSGKGFRDTLVWETIKRYLADLGDQDVVYFVTNNTEDYCLNGVIHPDLATEIEKMPAEFRIVSDLDTLFRQSDLEQLLAGLVASDDELAMLLRSATESSEFDIEWQSVGDTVKAAVGSAAESLIGEEVDNGNEVSSGHDFIHIGISRVMQNPTIDSVFYSDSSIEWEAYETYDETTVLVRATVVADVEISGFAYKSDCYDDDPPFDVLDWDWNDHMARVGLEVQTRLVFQLRVEVGVGVEDVEFEAAELLRSTSGDSELED